MGLLNTHLKEDSKVTTCILGGDFAMTYNDIDGIMTHLLIKTIHDDWALNRPWNDNDRAFLFKSASGEPFHDLTNMKKLMNWEDEHALVGAGIALASSQSIVASAQSRSTAAASASASAPSQSTATASASASVPSRGTASASALAPSRGVAATSSEQYTCRLREKHAQAAEKIVLYMEQIRQREANVQDNVKEEELAQADQEELLKLRVECETARSEFEAALRMEALAMRLSGRSCVKVEALWHSAEEATQEAKANDQCNVTKTATRKLVRLVAAAKSTSAKGLESFEPLSRKTKELAAVMDVDGYSDDEVNDDDKDSDKFQAAARRRQHKREKILRDNASAPSRGVAAQGQNTLCNFAARKATREGNGWRWSDEPLQDLVQNILQWRDEILAKTMPGENRSPGSPGIVLNREQQKEVQDLHFDSWLHKVTQDDDDRISRYVIRNRGCKTKVKQKLESAYRTSCFKDYGGQVWLHCLIAIGTFDDEVLKCMNQAGAGLVQRVSCICQCCGWFGRSFDSGPG